MLEALKDSNVAVTVIILGIVGLLVLRFTLESLFVNLRVIFRGYPKLPDHYEYRDPDDSPTDPEA